MRLLLIGAALSAISPAAFSSDLAPIREAERIALERLYASTDGSHWCNHDGWLGARGTECQWHGVFCGFRGDPMGPSYSVNTLDLSDNNLVGSLPAELDDLTNLEYLHLYGNSISGMTPPGILNRWEEGPLVFQGYAEIAGLWEISLQYRSSAFCAAFEATLRSDGSASLSSERCKSGPRMKWQGSQRLGVSCESQRGWTDRFGDAFSRLALLLERQGFGGLEPGYGRNITHGGDMITSVVRNGERKTVTDYAESGPMNLWLIEAAIQGVIRDAEWERTSKSARCNWKEFAAIP